MLEKNKAFTLIEILVTIAIVAILAAVVLVSMTSYRSKARSTKALAELSSVIPSMVSCWGNPPYIVSVPDNDGGECICKNGTSCVDSYGSWPQSTGDLGSYVYNTGPTFENRNWRVRWRSPTSADRKQICCNSAMNSCVVQDYDSGWPTCNNSNPSN